MSAKVTGLDELKAKLEKLKEQFPKVVIKAVYQEANVIMTESKKLCPVATGRLRASGYVSNPTTEEGEQFVRVGYGADYALAVHERTEVHHGPVTAREADAGGGGHGLEGTGSKFLSRPVDAHRHSFVSDVAERIKNDPKVEEWKKGDL